MSGYIYAIRCCDFVKLGFATDPHKRRSQMAVGIPFETELLGYSKGTRADEAALHNRFAADHVRGEWFWHRGEVAAFVAQMEFRGVNGDRRFGPRTSEQCAKIKEGLRLAAIRQEAMTREMIRWNSRPDTTSKMERAAP